MAFEWRTESVHFRCVRDDVAANVYKKADGLYEVTIRMKAHPSYRSITLPVAGDEKQALRVAEAIIRGAELNKELFP